MNLTNWAAAVQELREAARVPEATLAQEAGLTGPSLFRYLRNQRRPKEETVQAINLAVAQILMEPNAAKYLDAVYFIEVDDNRNVSRSGAVDGFMDTLKLSLARLRDDARAELAKTLAGMEPRRKRRLILAVNRAYRRRLVRHILGDDDPEKSSFDEFREIFKRNGIDVTPLMLPKEESARLDAEDEFRRRLRKALSSVINEPITRFKTEGEIMIAFYDYSIAFLEYSWATLGPKQRLLTKGAKR